MRGARDPLIESTHSEGLLAHFGSQSGNVQELPCAENILT